MAAPARAAAFRALRAITSGRADLGDALSSARDRLGDPRDRALATELATGTLRWRNAIDYQLQQRSAKPLHKLDAAVLDALRLGAYQLLYLARVPTSAAVNDSVDLVKRAGLASAAAFANAVLRRLARERGALTWPPRDALAEHLATVHSHPLWLVQRWLQRYGEEATERWVRFNNEPPRLTLSPNRLRITRDQLMDRLRSEGLTVHETTHAPHGMVVTDGRPLASSVFAEGYCTVQDEASQLIPELVAAAPGVAGSRVQGFKGARLLDLCASPGGKTIALAAQCGPQGLVVATDVRAKRVRLLAETMTRCRVPHVSLVHVPQRGALPFIDGAFDAVLIDAPCSGLGTIRRDPDIRWRREAAQLPAFAAAQGDLLQRARPLIKPGGRIVYSTCSSEPEENEAVVAAFLAEAPEFSLTPLKDAGLAAEITGMATAEGWLRTHPDLGLEMFFGAILQRR